MNTSVLSAVFKRNFFSYFTNPTGYVFICVFVFLSAIAAFWTGDFFNANLANLDQLNKFFPFIMLFFVPAITMSIWAEETRQGTDELLLTMPAADFDIVLGKYLAAVAIYTVALLISMLSNFVVLSQLGSPDLGLYLCTHLGYWFLGLAMLSIGMIASFLTRNLTVAYILGALFNAPLVLMARIDIVPGLSHSMSAAVRQWSMGGQCQTFGQGILGFAGIAYFLSIAAIMLYACMVLIGRRNWARGENTARQSGHFLARAAALAVIAVAAVFAVENHDLRYDATSEQLSALSPYTIKLVKDLRADYDQVKKLQPEIAKLEEVVKKQEEAQKRKDKVAEEKAAAKPVAAAVAANDAKDSAAKPAEAKGTKPAEAKGTGTNPQTAATKPEDKKSEEKKTEVTAVVKPAVPPTAEAKQLAELREKFDKLKIQGPVRIDAFISAEVPESYVQARINVLNVLREFKALGGDMVELEINDMQRADPLSEVAKARFNILPKEKFDNSGGTYKKDNIFMGVAFTCGLEKMILPFIDRGLPAEYELVRSLCTVTGQKRKRIGVLETDAHINGNFGQMGMTPAWQLIEELKKQYEVVQVKPGDSTQHYDVLLAVQPSAMGPEEMNGFIAAVRGGKPTLILEDPFFFWMRGIPGTYQPRQPQQQNPMMGMGAENQQKGDIRALWKMLGIDFSDGGEGEEFNPMAGPQPPQSMGRIAWQRYSPYPKLGDINDPEFVFIDHACGAKLPYCEEDSISSKLQNMFFPGPGFIENTPEMVKRLVAKWHNAQYTKHLEQEMRKLNAQFESHKKLSIENSRLAEGAKGRGKEDDAKEFSAKAQQERDTAIKAATELSEADEELEKVSAGGEGSKTIRPDQIKDGASLESVLKDLGPAADNSSVGELRRDVRARFGIRVFGVDISADDEPETLRAEAAKSSEEAAALKEGAGKLVGNAAKEARDKAHAKAETARVEEAMAKLREALSQAATVADLIQYAQGVTALQIKDRTFVPLVQSASEDAGTVPVSQLLVRTMDGEKLNPIRSLYYQPSDGQQYVLAAHIQGKPVDASEQAAGMNVVLVADADMIGDQFFAWREQGKMPGQDIDFDFDNVTFVLNALDSLAGDDRFLELRKRRPQHRTLERFDAKKRQALEETAQARKKMSAEHDGMLKTAIEEMKTKGKEIELEAAQKNADAAAIAQQIENAQRALARKLEEKKTENDQKYDKEMQKINYSQESTIVGLQDTYKFWSVIIPPIPPLLVAALVFFNRRAKEREGVSSKRLR